MTTRCLAVTRGVVFVSVAD